MIINPEHLGSYSVYDLLQAASHATVGIDKRWLHALIDNAEKNLPEIARFAAEDHSEDPVPLDEDLISIFRYLKSPQGLPFLLRLIRENSVDISDEVVEAMVEIGQPAVEPLLQLYSELGALDGGEVAFLLAGMGIKDEPIKNILLERIDISWHDALFHLEVYRDPSVIPELERRAALLDGESLLDIQNTIDDLRENQPQTHVSGFNIWENYPDTAEPDYDLASEEDRLELLDSPSAEQRTEVARSFVAREFGPQIRAKLLDVAKNDPDASVRGSAWEAFLDSTDDPELRRIMLACIAKPDTPKQERAGLAIALCRHPDNPVVHDAILKLAEDPETRAKAAEAMWRSFDRSFGRFAVEFLKDENSEVRRNAIWMIGYLSVSGEAGRLEKFFDDEEFRPDALHNYALAAPGPTNKSRVKTLYKKIDDLARGLTEAESDVVKAGLDLRLMQAGFEPIFQQPEDIEEPESEPESRVVLKIGRNDPCTCGSGKKYKKCCGQS